jgi:tripartite-type tricarboxylate transporter receptor subunit TctC
MSKRRFVSAGLAGVVAGLLGAVLSTAPTASFAQDDYPSKPVRVIVPFPAGGTSDVMGRLIASTLSKTFNKPFVVENKAGAGGVIGSTEVARATPDGYTLLLSGIGSNAIVHGMTPKPPYDSSRDFIQVSQLAAGPNVLVVNPEFPARTFAEFIAYVKANPGKVSYGVVNAASGHLTSEYLKQIAGLDMVGVPYRGGAPAMMDVIANQIPMMFTNLDGALPHMNAGKLRALAITSAQRSPIVPDVPTIAESGYPGFTAVSWTGLSAPKGTPKPIVDKLEAAMRTSFSDPEVRARLQAQGLELIAGSSEDYSRFMQGEIDRWTEVIQRAGIKPE